ncbi:MAG TPA: DUF3105 domain-containing protein [Actinomycetota bacterium]
MAKKRKRRPSGPRPAGGSRPKGTKPAPSSARGRTVQPAERRNWGVVRFAAIAGFIGLGWLLFFRTTGPGQVSASARSSATAAGCGDLEQPVVPNPSRVHLAPGESFDYPDRPAAAGPHDASPLPPDPHVYRIPVPETRAVHNLEHAYVIIYYRPAAEGGLAQLTIDRLAAIARDESRVIMAPYPALPDDRAFALLAWNTRWMCPATISADEAVTMTTSFIDAFRGTSVAPEAPHGLLGPLFQK